jgi:hypothetical protein
MPLRWLRIRNAVAPRFVLALRRHSGSGGGMSSNLIVIMLLILDPRAKRPGPKLPWAYEASQN